MTDPIPVPMTPPDCDLRNFSFMPLDVVRFAQSDLVALEDPGAVLANVLLWCASWHSVPAASLTDDDRVLARLAGYGRGVSEWQAIRTGALHGWVRCADGRLYHPVVAEKALEAWQGKLKQQHRTLCAAIRKHNERHPNDKVTTPDFEAWDAAGRPTSISAGPDGKSAVTTRFVTRDKAVPSHVTNKDRDVGSIDVGADIAGRSLVAMAESQTSAPGHALSRATSSGVTRDNGGLSQPSHAQNHSKGQGQGQGDSYSPSDSSTGDMDTTPPVLLPVLISAPDNAQVAFDRHDALRREFTANARPVEFTDGRRKKMLARLKDVGGLAGWDEVLGTIRASAFLRGDRSRNGFVPKIDWLLKPENLRKLREGDYDDHEQPFARSGSKGRAAAISPRSADAIGAGLALSGLMRSSQGDDR